MRQKTYLDAIFAVIDTWTIGTTPVEYARFAHLLYVAIANPIENELRPLAEVRGPPHAKRR